jgi:probable phosphoglycerate mutase
MNNAKMIELYFLRHAETDFNAHNKFIGGRSNHIPLSELGDQQAKQVGENFRENEIKFEKVYCSPAVRTKETLQIILNETSLSDNPIEYSDDLQELSQGEWEGRLREEIYTPERLAEINSNQWLFKAPGGESQKEVEERMLHFIEHNILNQYSTGKFLIIGHGIAFKCLLRGILEITTQVAYKLLIENASMTKLRFDMEKGWFVDFLNCKCY